MRRIKIIEQRLVALESCLPDPGPWLPVVGSFAWCLYERLGAPKERMDFLDMYEKVVELVWNEDRCSE